MDRRKRPRKCFIAELAGTEELLWLKPNWTNEDLEIKFTRLLFWPEIFSTIYATYDCRSSTNSTVSYATCFCKKSRVENYQNVKGSFLPVSSCPKNKKKKKERGKKKMQPHMWIFVFDEGNEGYSMAINHSLWMVNFIFSLNPRIISRTKFDSTLLCACFMLVILAIKQKTNDSYVKFLNLIDLDILIVEILDN